MPSSSNPDWVLDPVWFPIWADIVIPTFIGVATVGVAVAAFVASSRAQRMSLRALAQAEERDRKIERRDFVDLIREMTRIGSKIQERDVRHQAEIIQQGAEEVLDWFRTSQRMSDVTDPSMSNHWKTVLHLQWSGRSMEWICTGVFDSTPLSESWP